MKVGDKVRVTCGDYEGMIATVAHEGPHQFDGEMTVKRQGDDKIFYFKRERLAPALEVTPEEQTKSFHLFEVLLDSAEESHELSKAFYNELLDCGLLHAQKQRDYGKEHDPFANVRSSEEWGIPPWVGAMVRLNDKVKRLQSLAKTGGLANESAIDSFRDIAVYALIALVLYQQESARA